MKKLIISKSFIIIAYLFMVALVSCKKEDGPLSDIRPAIPVTVSNAIAYRPEPTVSTTLASTDSIITIMLQIPAGSGKKIDSIKVALSTSYTQIQSTGTTGFYPLGTKVYNGNTVTFTTNLREYYINKPLNATSNPAPAANKEQVFRYYFKLFLNDGTVLISEPVRVLVL